MGRARGIFYHTVKYNRQQSPENGGGGRRSDVTYVCLITKLYCDFIDGDVTPHFRIPLHEHMEFTAILDTLPADWNLCFVEVQGKSSSEPIRSIPYHEADFTSPTLMVFGREVGGLSSDLKEQAIKHGSHNIISTYIPTIPQLDSINVSMAATVLIYEMVSLLFYPSIV